MSLKLTFLLANLFNIVQYCALGLLVTDKVTSVPTLTKHKVMQPSITFTKPAPPVLHGIILHQSLSLVCEAASIHGPAPLVFWQRKGQAITGVENEELKSLNSESVVTSSTKSILYIDCISAADLGMYSCVAETNSTRIVTETTIILLTSHHTGGSFFNRARCDTSNVPIAAPPRILMWSRNTLQKQGTTATLFCRAAGNPPPSIVWEVHHSEDPAGEVSRLPLNSKKHEISPNGDLRIYDVTWQHDMGNYICVAENSVGSDRAESFLYPV